jgi:methyl-accepting chemotaxis protein
MLKNAKLGIKIGSGFLLMGLLLVLTVSGTMWQVHRTKDVTDRSIELRAPTLQTSLTLLNGMNRSLAALRGWIILGKEKFRDERALAWNEEIDGSLGIMKTLSQNWTDPANVERLARIEKDLEQFRVYQQEIEDIARTRDNNPASKILFEEAAPLASTLASSITSLIDQEQVLGATAERKALLGMMADVRGTTGLSLASIRAYLLSGESRFKDDFDRLWAKNTRRFADLEANSALLTADQQTAFEAFSQARGQFDPLPPQMFEIRSSSEWNLANAWLGSKAAPIAAMIVEDVQAMVVSQRELMATDASTALALSARLNRLLWILAAVGIFASALLGVLITRTITRPVSELLGVAQNVALGATDQVVAYESRDEIGELADVFRNLVESMSAKATAAEQIGAGNLEVQIQVASEEDVLGKAMIAMRKSINRVVAETDGLVEAAVEGRLGERADGSKFHGSFRQIIEGINTTLDALVGHLNAVPAPAMIIDTEFTVQYLNDAAATMTGKTADSALGMKCHELFATGDCRSESCALKQAMTRGEQVTSETDAHPNGQDLEISYTGVPVKNQKGEVIGALEVVTDLTAIKHASRKARKVKEYQDGEVDKLTTVLDKLSRGDLSTQAEVAGSDGDTAETREVFEGIAGAVNQTIDAIGALVGDSSKLAHAAKAGELQTRADASKHGGDFGEVVSGINETLDAVVGPITEAAQVLDKMAVKDLSSRVAGDYKGDHAKIKSTLNSALENVGESMGMVLAGSDQVASAANQISVGAQSLAQGASEQASSIEEISASLQEMTSMSRKNSENADEARNLTSAASTASDQGMDAMRRLSGAIDKIKDSSSDTAKIIKTIDEIAFQTNLLALNASVEAARAGDAGKGFAVVAEEVRNLAMRSTEAAKSTSELIEESVNNSEQGVAINNEVLDKLEEINGKVQSVNEVMVEIASSSNQQNSSLGQVAEAIEQLNLVTQQNAANSEESASSAEELQSQAQEMLQMVGAFKLEKGSQASPAPAPAPVIKPVTEAASKQKVDDDDQLIGAPAMQIPLDEAELEILGEF